MFRNEPYTIFQVIELQQYKKREENKEPEIESEIEDISQDEFAQFVLCVKNLNKPSLRKIDEQRVEIAYWLSTYFGRNIPTSLLLPIIDIDFSANALSMFLPRVGFDKLTASLEDVYGFLKNIAPAIEVSDETINQWRKETGLRNHQQRYRTIPTTSRIKEQ